MADYQQAFADRFDQDRHTDAWFLASVQAAVWSKDPLKPRDFWEGEQPALSLEEKKALLKEQMERVWPKPQP